MAIGNRELDVSQQKDVYNWVSAAHGGTTVNTGATAWIGMVPYPGVIQSLRAVATGNSGLPSVALQIFRAGAGGTTIACSISTLIMYEAGASVMVGYSGLAATGSTLLQVQAGDVLQFQTGVANTACGKLVLEVVVKKTQDIVSYNGISS